MSRRSVVLSLGLLALVATGVVIYLGRERTPEARPPPSNPVARGGDSFRATSSTVLESAPRPAGESAKESQRTIVVTPPEGAESDPELREAIWIEGRVVILRGTPSDEHAEIVADGNRFANRPLHRSVVGSDGSFRVAFAHGTGTGFLRLEARYLYLENGRTVDLTKPPKNLVLEPQLGGWLRGRLTFNPSVLGIRDQLAGCSVHAVGAYDAREAKISNELTFDVLGLPPGLEHDVSVEARDVAPLRRDRVVVEPGQALTLELEVMAGTSLSGHVLDDRGGPIRGASVFVSAFARDSFHRTTETNSDGSFEMRGLPSGAMTLAARAPGFVEGQVELADSEDGSARPDIEVVLQRSRPISGRVLWPDGQPASACKIEYTYLRRLDHGFTSGGRDIQCDHDGQFEITELAQEPISISASAVPSASYEKSASARSIRSRLRPPPWLAHIEGVSPGTDGLVLTLKEGGVVRGRVIDEAGSPVASSSVEAISILERGRNRMSVSCDKLTGAFEVDGLYDGQWSLEATARGYVPAPSPAITIPGESRSIDLVMRRGATIGGIVVDLSGSPVSGSTVSVSGPRGNRYPLGRTGSEGLFRIDCVEPGSLQIQAHAKGMKPGESIRLDVQSGQEVTQLRLTLGPAISDEKNH